VVIKEVAWRVFKNEGLPLILRMIGVGQFIPKSSRIYPFKVFLWMDVVEKL